MPGNAGHPQGRETSGKVEVKGRTDSGRGKVKVDMEGSEEVTEVSEEVKAGARVKEREGKERGTRVSAGRAVR